MCSELKSTKYIEGEREPQVVYADVDYTNWFGQYEPIEDRVILLGKLREFYLKSLENDRKTGA